MNAPVRNVDVRGLPDHAYGLRTVLGWGTLGFIAIEGTVFATLVASCLYGYARAELWPPPPFGPSLLVFGVVNTVLLLLSLLPNVLCRRAAETQNLPRVRGCLLAMLALEVAFLVVRGYEFAGLEVRWDDNFYGSILWTMLAAHTLHLFADVVETAVLFALAYRRGIRPHRFADIHDNATYWYFAVVAWLPLAALIYVLPRLG